MLQILHLVIARLEQEHFNLLDIKDLSIGLLNGLSTGELLGVQERGVFKKASACDESSDESCPISDAVVEVVSSQTDNVLKQQAERSLQVFRIL